MKTVNIMLTVDPARFDNPVALGVFVLAKLRERGVPVLGSPVDTVPLRS